MTGVVGALLLSAQPVMASAATLPAAGSRVSTKYPHTVSYILSSRPRSAQVNHPNANLSGDCGKVNFINYGGGNYYVIVDSYQGGIWWISYYIQGAGGSTSGTRYPYGTPSHYEWGGHINYWGGPLLLEGGAFTTWGGYCYFIPNPA
jgi:hypothetical protein